MTFPGPIAHALLVGVNDYEPDPVTGREIDLNGCVWDAKAVGESLLAPAVTRILAEHPGEGIRVRARRGRLLRRLRRRRGRTAERFGAPVLTFLTDRDATLARVRKALAALCSRIGAGETGLWFRSGHGTAIRGAAGERDGTDEAFCCADALAGGYLVDGEIAGIISANLRDDAHLVIIADTCHAGDSHRSPGLLAKARGIAGVPRRPGHRHYVIDDRLPANVTAWYACASDEVAWERPAGGKVRGAFTRAIEPHLPALAAGTLDIEDAHLAVSRELAGVNADGGQMPQLERGGV